MDQIFVNFAKAQEEDSLVPQDALRNYSETKGDDSPKKHHLVLNTSFDLEINEDANNSNKVFGKFYFIKFN